MDPEGIVKQASVTDLDKAAVLLETIHEENPKLWPNGLTVGHFSPGNLWLIQKSASDSPVGFVGWQSRKVDGVPTGYYSIGVLPEYRHRGIAKKAVAQLLATKAASVERVRALIVPGNVSSERLAHSLDVPVEKAAGLGDVGRVLGAISKDRRTSMAAGGLGTMLFQDNLMRADREGHQPFSSITDVFKNDTRTNLINGLNFGLGAWGGHSLHKGHSDAAVAKAIRDFPGAPAETVERGARLLDDARRLSGSGVKEMAIGAINKDLLLDAHNAVYGLFRMGESAPKLVEAVGNLSKKEAPVASGLGTKGALGASALLALALGGGAYGISRALGKQKADQQQLAGGRLKVTLPTRNPTDSETTIDLPFDQFSALSPALRQRIERDTRRRLHAETNARTRRIGTQALTAVA